MAFDILESGEGDTILFLPGSFSTTAAWAGVWSTLPNGYRLLSANLPGYGGADDPRIGTDSHMDRLTDWLYALFNKISEPVHLVGHSFGGQIALAAMLKGRANVRSLTTFEANPVFVIQMATRSHGSMMCAQLRPGWLRRITATIRMRRG